MFPTDAVIVAGARTPMARYNGVFYETTAIELGAVAAREAIRRSGADTGEFDHVIFGNVMQTSADALYCARHVGLKAGLPVETPGVTVNRLCGSGIESISQAAQRILLGEAKVVLAGGTENMSQAPHVIRGARAGFRLGEGKLEDSLVSGLYDPMGGCTMSDTAENLAAQHKISRRECDEYALRSQQTAEAAFRACKMKEEITPVEVKKGKKTIMVTEDDHRRPETTTEILAALPAAFRKDGVTTAGNASGIVDGAAAAVVAHEKTAKERGWKPLGRIVSWATAGVEPRIMGIGPVPAIRKALGAAKMELRQIDLIEVNEAFAAQYLA
ncbi:MAG: acetyl-CoA C-acyltransferase, partial [Steroidobacteraceae bacterium]